MKKIFVIVLAVILLVGCSSTQSGQNKSAAAAMPSKTGLNPGDEVGISGTNNNFTLQSLDFLDESTGFVVKVRSDIASGGADSQLLKTTDSGTHWDIVGNAGNSLSEVKFINQNEGWAISSVKTNAGSGTDSSKDLFRYAVLHTTDGGTNWDSQWQGAQTSGVKYDLWFADQSNGFALVGDTLLSTQDGGKQWTAAAFGQKDFIPQSMCFTDAKTGWVMGSNRQSDTILVLYTADGGKTWTRQFKKEYSDGMVGSVGIDFINATTGWFLTSDMSSWNGELYRTDDGGRHWQMINQIKSTRPSPESIRFITEKIGWIPLNVGAGPVAGGLMFTRDGGKSFRMMGKSAADESGETQKITDASDVDFISEKQGWAIGIDTESGDFLVRTTDGGNTWEQVFPKLTPTRDVFFVNDRIGYGIAEPSDGGALLETSNDGSTWENVRSFTGEYLPEKISFIDSKTGWMAASPETENSDADTPAILHTSDGGKTWAKLSSLPAYIEIEYFRFFDAKNGLVITAGENGTFLRTKDGGKTWKASSKNIPASGLDQYAFRNADDGWELCNPGNYKTAYDISVSRMTNGAVWQTPTGVASGGASYALTTLPGQKLMMLIEEPPYQQSSRMKLLVSADDGKTWEPHILPEGFNGFTLGMLQSQLPMQFTNATHGWILTPYGLLATQDGGRTWVWK